MFGDYFNPLNPFGDMPEIPEEQLKDASPEDMHLIGCLHLFAVMAGAAVLLAICALIAWIF